MTIVYVDMCADLFHYGHVRILKNAKSLGNILVVGIHSNETIESYKRTPIMSMEERIELVGLKITKDSIDLTNREGFSWLRENLMDEAVELFQANKE